MRVHLQALGCRLNEAELETWSRQFSEQGFSISTEAEQADLVVVNTCAVTDEAVRKSRKLLRRTQRANPQAKLVVSGCYASLAPGEAAEALGVDLVVPNQHKDRLVEIARRELDLHSMPVMATEPGENPLLARSRQRAFIKVQDGCRYRCTFCIVTEARGNERSTPIADVVEQVNRLHAEGIQEAVLTGVHIGGYGSDTGSSLEQLLGAVLADTDMPRIRIGSIEPWDLSDGFWRLFDNPRFQPHLHLPLQSGADSVLRRMARRCKTVEYRRLVDAARDHVKDFNVTTDIIVGFPGETEAEWRQTMDYVADIGFSHLHIFPFSARGGTRAANLPQQLGGPTKRQRGRELHELAERMRLDCLRAHLGRRFEVLVEGKAPSGAEPGSAHGYTPNFLPLVIRDAEHWALTNQIIACDMVGVDESAGMLIAKPIKSC